MSFFAPGAPGASPSAFTSPGMNPASLLALLAMQGGTATPGVPGGVAPMPQFPSVGSFGAGGGAPIGMRAPMPPGATGAPSSADPLTSLLAMDPQKLKQMLGMFGLGAKPSPGVPMPNATLPGLQGANAMSMFGNGANDYALGSSMLAPGSF